ncbi:MAG: mechanosensitive ion channel family protein [Candidatus Thermoplasmatota archaeon]|jgi:small-conductance mechanosensitive channel|nr:mechanosensitive ion channel family protein [Candidatus Thermoplasmatota archaeon]
MAASTEKPPEHLTWLRVGVDMLSVLAIIVLGTAFIYFFLTPQIAPQRLYLLKFAYLALIIIVAILLISIIGGFIRRFVVPRASRSVGSSLQLVFNVFAYIALFVGVFYLLGVDITALLLGAGFFGIVLGLAAQQVLGNFFGAVALLTARPFNIGDRITFTTWQYSVMASTFPHEATPAGHTGTVQNIGLMYTFLLGDDGRPMVIPNGILSGSFILNHSKVSAARVRVRVTLSRKVNFRTYSDLAGTALRGVPSMVSDSVRLHVVSVAEATYDVAVTAEFRKVDSEYAASTLLERLLPLSESLPGANPPAHKPAAEPDPAWGKSQTPL